MAALDPDLGSELVVIDLVKILQRSGAEAWQLVSVGRRVDSLHGRPPPTSGPLGDTRDQAVRHRTPRPRDRSTIVGIRRRSTHALAAPTPARRRHRSATRPSGLPRISAIPTPDFENRRGGRSQRATGSQRLRRRLRRFAHDPALGSPSITRTASSGPTNNGGSNDRATNPTATLRRLG